MPYEESDPIQEDSFQTETPTNSPEPEQVETTPSSAIPGKTPDHDKTEGLLQFEGKEYLTISQAQAILHKRGSDISTSFIRGILKEKKLPAFRISGRRGIFVPLDDFETFFAEGGFQVKCTPAF